MAAIKVGLTGGICCGKTTALRIFERHGFDAIDLDRHVHEALQGNERVKSGLKKRFGAEYVGENDGQVLTNRLAELVFNDKSALVYLENLIYPEIEMLWKRVSPTPSVVEVPLLFEQNLHVHFDCSICVYTTYPVQLGRAIAHRNWSPEELNLRLAQQLPIEEKILRADFVIGNGGTLLQFERQIQIFLENALRKKRR
jgi:dephospho-CoA kinase